MTFQETTAFQLRELQDLPNQLRVNLIIENKIGKGNDLGELGFRHYSPPERGKKNLGGSSAFAIIAPLKEEIKTSGEARLSPL